MKNTTGRGAGWKQALRRNAVAGAIVLFVGVAVYLNWNYQQGEQADAGKTLGDAALVGGTQDPLLGESGGGGAQTGDVSGQVQSADGAAGEEQGSNSYFAAARLNRQQARDSALELLQQATEDENADQTVRSEASAAIQTMADCTVTEAQIENLVVAKGYADCVAFINGDSASVVVEIPGAEMTAEDTARIMDIVSQATGFAASQIKIIQVE